MVKVKPKFSYWSIQNLISRNAVFNWAIGGRSLGKTHDTVRHCISHYLKTGRYFIYMRRYEPEFDDKDKFFENVDFRFPNHEFKVDGMRGYVRSTEGCTEDENGQMQNSNEWNVCVYFIILSKTYSKKSVPYREADYIIYDEFIIDKGHTIYLRNEVTKFLDFYNTVDRFEDRVKVFFLANPISIVNPYFIYFKMKPRKPENGSTFLLKGKTNQGRHYLCCEIIKNEKFIEEINQTEFVQFISDTDYYDYAVGGDFKDNTEKFLAKKSDESKFVYAFRFDGVDLGFWADYDQGVYYVVKKVPKMCNPFVLTKDDMEPNLLMVKKTSPLLKNLYNVYSQGSMYFDDVQTRELFRDILEYMAIR